MSGETLFVCYGCGDKVKLDDLRYECMCTVNENGFGHGVCKKCENRRDISIPEDHHLRKLHDFSPEWNDFWNRVSIATKNNWHSFSQEEDYWEFTYDDYGDIPKKKAQEEMNIELNKLSEELKEKLKHVTSSEESEQITRENMDKGNIIWRRYYKKIKIYNPPKGKSCTCCKE